MKITCQICQKEIKNFRELSKHITNLHKEETLQSYYDKYLFKNTDSKICKICGKPNKFYNIKLGYTKFCSKKCGAKNTQATLIKENRFNKLSKNIRNKIITEYQNGLSSPKLAKKYDVSKPTILNYLRRNNIKRKDSSEAHKTYKVNSNYFEKLDSKDKTYILGWLLSDGNNLPKKGSIRLRIQEGDRKILEKINLKLENENPLKIEKREPRYKNSCGLFINDVKMSNDLNKIGMVPNKSLILKFPEIHEDYYASLLRGMLEGDGCYYLGKKSFCVSLLSTIMFLEKAKEIIENKLKIYVGIHRLGNNYKSVTQRLSISSQYSCEKFLDWIYEDVNNGSTDLFLDRKYKKYLKLKNILQEKKLKKLNKPIHICKIENCDRKVHAKDLCNLHYKKMLRKKRKNLTISL